ncbi:MAG: hypothetical protein ACOZIN_20830 [Myxococcota bacterium]
MTPLPIALLLCAAPALAGGGVSLTTNPERKASLLDGEQLEATYQPSQSSALRLTDGLRFDRQGLPTPLDSGGGVSGENRQILALLLGLIIGFGIGHLVAQDRDGFVLFLIIDIAILAAASVFTFWVRFPFLWLAFLASHIIQGLDAYAEAGGPRLIERTRERAVRFASTWGKEEPATTTRVFAWSF